MNRKREAGISSMRISGGRCAHSAAMLDASGAERLGMSGSAEAWLHLVRRAMRPPSGVHATAAQHDEVAEAFEPLGRGPCPACAIRSMNSLRP